MKVHFEGTPVSAEQSRGLRVDYAAAKRNIPAWRWNLIVLVLVSPVLYLLGKGLLEQVWVASPGRVELRETTLHAGQLGRIGFIAAPGSRVEAGSTVAVILPPPAEASPAPPVPERRVESNAGKTLLAYRRERVRRYRELWRLGAATQAELAGALAQLAEAEAAYERVRKEAVPTPRPPATGKPEEIRIIAPSPGVVSQLAASSGDWITAGADLLTLIDDSHAQVVAYVDPRRARYAEPGRSARLNFPDGGSLHAKVAEVRIRTARMPGSQGVLLESGAEALQIVLVPEEALPARYRRHQLPVEVRFDFAWPRSLSGSV